MSINSLYPEIEPFSTQMLAVSPRHSLYVERSGKKGGYPIFFVHGGPGSHSRAAHRRYFDPDFFDIVLFDQRGCGKSVPAGEIEHNDTWALVEDINSIRDALGIGGKISLLGGSWGSTLALAYASRYPQWVDELILRGVFLGTDQELEWYTHGLSRFAPDAWQQFSSAMGEDLLGSYYDAVLGDAVLGCNLPGYDPQRASDAARRWAEYEMQLMSTGSITTGSITTGSITTESVTTATGQAQLPTAQVSQALLNSVRIQLHFLKHRCFLHNSPLLEAAANIHLPVTIVQGALDLVCPPITAWRLSQRLPQATLRLISSAGHSALSGNLAMALKAEVDALRDRRFDRQHGYHMGRAAE